MFLSCGIDDLRISVLIVHGFVGVEVGRHHVAVGDVGGQGKNSDCVEIRLFEIALHLRQFRTIFDDVLDAVQRLRTILKLEIYELILKFVVISSRFLPRERHQWLRIVF